MTRIISQQTKKINTKLSIFCKDDRLYDYLLEYKIYPQSGDFKGNCYVAIFMLDGYFATRKAIEYYNDIIARFMLSMPELNLHFKSERVKNDENTTHLAQLQNLKSIPVLKNTYSFVRNDHLLNSDDLIFWALKAYFESLIRIKAHTYDKLEQYAILNFKDKAKDYSTLKAKCRSIYYWYLDRDFKVKETKYQRKLNDKELFMTRSENMKKVNALREQRNSGAIRELIESLFSADYKKPNGTFNKTKIAKDLNISLATVNRYFKRNNIK